MATATLISYPSALCLAGNIEPVRVSAAGLFTFRLKKGSTVLLEEDYVPDSSGQAEIDIRDIILADLSLSLPTSDVYKQVSAVSSYTITTDTDTKTFTAVLGGVDRPSTDAATFLQANFLTWQPQIKSVTYDQPEWLSFYTPATAIALKAKFYLKAGTTDTVTVAGSTSFDTGCIYSVNVQFARLWNMGEGDRYGMVDVWLEDDQGTALTYVQRYVLDTSGDERTVLVARNSLGGIDTFSFRGGMERAAEVEHTNVLRGETLYSGLLDLTRTYTVNTGILSRHERDWVWDLQRSPQAWALMDGALLPVVMLAPAVTASMYEDSTGTVDFYISDDSGYLNIPRIDTMPADIEIPGPDGEVFFLAPRLIDFQDAVLDQSLLIPVQSPLLQEWRKISVGSLSSYLLSLVDDKYQSSIHVHDNFSVLSRLSVDENGRLLFDGGLVGGGSGIVGAHDHHGETIRPSALVIPTTAPSADSGLRPGEYSLYLDTSSAVDGEVPTKAGLDEDELWAILSGNEGTEVVAKQHLPSDTVYSEALSDYIKKSDVNTSDLVTLSTEQTVTGKKTFAEDVVLGGQRQDGSFAKAYIPSTAGAGLYFLVMDSSSAVDGETPTKAGLDEEELWAILSGNAGTEVVAKQHLPSDTVYGDGLAQTLLPYATQEWVAGRGYLTSVKLSTISDLDAGWDSLLAAAPAGYVTRWPKFSEVSEMPDTIAGFGITDAYTKGEVNTELAKYVTLGTAQTVSGDKTHSGDVVFGAAKADGSGYGRMYVPSTAGAGLFYLVMDSASAVDGETPSIGGGGIDEEELWSILGGSGAEQISKSHLPSDTVYSDGLAQALSPYATQEWVAGRGYLTQSAADGRYVNKSGDTMSGNLIVSGASFYKKMTNDTSNASSAIGWKKAADDTTLATIGYYNLRKAIYLNSHIFETVDLWQDAVGKYTLFIGVNDLTYNTYPILRSDNIGSYALTPSNYASTLDGRYVKKAGDTMTGPLTLPSIAGSYSLKIGTFAGIQCDSTFGILLQYESTFINVTNSGLKRNNSHTIWDSGNDGSGSGLDADTVDGTHSWNLFITNAGGLSSSQLDTFVNRQSGTYNVSYSGYSRTLTVFRGTGSSSAIELLSYYTGQLWCRWTIDSNRYNEAGFREFAFTDSNVASATKLQTARSLWGNSFDGGQNLTGRIWAYNGINIGSLDDYGWFNSSNRISCGLNVARGCNVGSLLVSNTWADSTKVPTNGIYSKGAVVIDGTLTAGGNVIAYSSSSRLVKDILPAVSYSRRLKSLGRVVDYRYNGLLDRDRDIHTGLLYENVRDIMPSMCFMHEGYGALNYLDKDYICTIAGAVQENIDDIMYLKNKVASLEAEVARLRRGLAA